MLLQGQLGIRKSHNGFEEVLIGSFEFPCPYSSLFLLSIGCEAKQIIECLVCEPLQLTYFNLCVIVCLHLGVFSLFHLLLFKKCKCLPAPHLIFLS